MTVLAVWADGREVIVAADSLACGGSGAPEDRAWRDCRKLARLRVGGVPIVVGATGYRMLLSVATQVPPRRPGRDLDDWAGDWAARLTEAALKRHAIKDDEGQVSGSWLVGVRGRAFHLTHHTADEVTFAALGSGGPEAWGAMAALRPQVTAGALTRQEVLERAVTVACELTTSCGLPVHVERI